MKHDVESKPSLRTLIPDFNAEARELTHRVGGAMVNFYELGRSSDKEHAHLLADTALTAAYQRGLRASEAYQRGVREAHAAIIGATGFAEQVRDNAAYTGGFKDAIETSKRVVLALLPESANADR